MPPLRTLTPPPAGLETIPDSAPRTTHRPLLIATDGSEAAKSALLFAKLLARMGDPLHIVSVVEPAPIIVTVPEVPIYSPEADLARADALRARLTEDARAIFGEPLPTIDVLIGSPVQTLARSARDRHAQVVITGLRHHGRLERLMLRRETPIGLAREGLPVLVVPEGTLRLPRSALIAVDLDQASADAARRARPLLSAVEIVYLVHVRPGDTRLEGEAAARWERVYGGLERAAFDRVVAALELPTSVHVEPRTLSGHAVEELLDFAERQRVELIVAGYRRARFLDRLGGPHKVAERVLRGSTCAMLVVPEVRHVAVPPDLEEKTVAIADKSAWSMELTAFSQRNIGRAVSIEIDTMPLGAQGQVSGWPLAGIEYDAAAETVRMMFGEVAGGTPHLTHSIPSPESLEILRVEDGKDLALRVGHEGGYTLLTFE